MSSSREYTKSELLVVMTARLLEDRKTVFVGIGLPMLAAALAQRTHAPRITIIFEGGVIAPEIKPAMLPLSTNEVRAARRALALPTIDDIFFYQQRGYIDYGILGAAQIDKYGNINTSVIGSYEKPKVRLPGSGGANDIASTCSKVIISTLHEKRRFVEKVDFITSPGYLQGGESRRQSGLIFGGPYKVITDLAILGFDEKTKHMRLEAVYEGVTIDEVLSNTGFELLMSDEIKIIPPPTKEEIKTLRSIDPERMMLRG